ncbi:hypothetical protein GRI43_05525 [Altererythrobacter luteolus]|uniref:Uncharacterized protein n=1 Tax=Pontixanthobacter luteolus TaxID=295089 RepID=A0A6I4UY27_9SPHN|nr:hypothetical protein [Pontixanthobacter luteolus]MXP46849.1 hypothetical protein [Pontixanthobacter luteolus]
MSDPMDARGLIFLIGFVAATSFAAWLCFNRLSAAKATGKFRYVFHGIGEENWPVLFKVCKAFISVQGYVFCLMAGIGAIWFVIAIVGKMK